MSSVSVGAVDPALAKLRSLFAAVRVSKSALREIQSVASDAGLSSSKESLRHDI